MRILGDFNVAEEIVQDTLVSALEHWPVEGIPDRPGAWLWTAAKRRAIDSLRRDARYRDKLAQLAEGPLSFGPLEVDDRLRLIFTCCHPALSREARIALTLRAVCGLTTAQIARAFLTTEPTIAQRIVRAKRKIVDANIPYAIPVGAELAERRNEVLSVLYLMFNEGYLSSSDVAERRELAEDAAWLVGLMANLMPEDAEVMGLLALMRLHTARSEARFDTAGNIVLLQDQQRDRWDHRAISDAVQLLERARSLPGAGVYVLQASIAAVHAQADSWEATDWDRIVELYDELLRWAPSPVVRLNRAVAIRHVEGADSALTAVDQLANELAGYHLFHETRALLLDELGRGEEARAAHESALSLTDNPAEKALIESRLALST